nr:unnamed protein product [Callosobruchus chinensis]
MEEMSFVSILILSPERTSSPFMVQDALGLDLVMCNRSLAGFVLLAVRRPRRRAPSTEHGLVWQIAFPAINFDDCGVYKTSSDSMAFADNKTFWKNFISLYRAHPCLWQIKSKEYSNKHMKNAAYQELVEKCKEICPEADTKYVRKKIDSLRAGYRRELREIGKSKRTESSADDIYESIQSCLRSNHIRWFGRFALSSSIGRNYPEFIVLSFGQIWYPSSRLACRYVSCIGPIGTAFLFLLDDVASDRSAAVTLRPGNVDFGFVARLSRAGLVNSPNSEFVGSAFNEIIDFSFGYVTFNFCAFFPVGIKLVSLLDDVARDRRSTIGLWFFPFEFHEVLVVVDDFWGTGCPPSSAGGLQLSLHPLACTSDTLSGPPGGLGTSKTMTSTSAMSLPFSFSAVTVGFLTKSNTRFCSENSQKETLTWNRGPEKRFPEDAAWMALQGGKCGEAVETAKHVIFDCPALCRRRSSYLEVVQEDRHFNGLLPFACDRVLLFDNIFFNRSTTIVFRRLPFEICMILVPVFELRLAGSPSSSLRCCPFQVNTISIPVSNFWSTRFAWNVIWVLGNDGPIAFQGFRFPFVIDSLHAELILVPFLQPLHVHFSVIGSAHRHPTTCLFVQFLDYIAGYWFATIVFRFLPFQLAATLRYV